MNVAFLNIIDVIRVNVNCVNAKHLSQMQKRLADQQNDQHIFKQIPQMKRKSVVYIDESQFSDYTLREGNCTSSPEQFHNFTDGQRWFLVECKSFEGRCQSAAGKHWHGYFLGLLVLYLNALYIFTTSFV